MDRRGVAHVAEALRTDGVTSLCLDNCGLGDEELLPLFQVLARVTKEGKRKTA